MQEIRWAGKGRVNKNDYTIWYSGDEKQGHQGVAFAVIKKICERVIEFRPISERIAYIRIDAKPFKISLLNVYAPTENAGKEIKKKFYEEIEDVIETIKKEDVIILLGDFNAQIGREEYNRHVAGKHTAHETTNDNGQRLCGLAERNNLIISST